MHRKRMSKLSSWLEFETPAGRRIQVLHTVHPQARRLSITMGVDGPRLTVPRFVRAHEVHRFLLESSEWIEDKLRDLVEHGAQFSSPRVGVNDTILWRGERVPVLWRHARLPKVVWRADERAIEIAMDLQHPQADKRLLRAMRGFLIAEMRREVVRVTRVVTDQLGISPSDIRILPLKTLWGSLSYSHRMTLDLSLILAPPRALEYVVVHELCHLLHKDHSKRFWKQVEAIDPEYKTPRDWLTENGQVVKTELMRWVSARASH